MSAGKSEWIVGVLDLANSLVGDPLLEFARIRSYGLLEDSFLNGYGTPCPRDAVEEALMDICQLDTEAHW